MRGARVRAAMIICTMLVAFGAAAADPIEIAVIGPFTGGSSPMGLSMLQGVRLATAEINEAGGVLGRPIVLIERDDMARNEVGARIAAEMTGQRPVAAAIGIANVGVAIAAAPYFQQARRPLLIAVSTGSAATTLFAPPEYKENYIFRVSVSTVLEVDKLAQEVARRGVAKVAVFTDSTRYGQVGREELLAALGRHGLKPVAIEKFNIGDVDMLRQLRRAQAAGAELLLTYAIGPELAHIATGRRALGWNVPILGSWTLSMGNFIDMAGPDAEGVAMTQTFIQEKDTPARTAFIEAFQRRFDVDRIASPPSAAQGYDAIHLLAAAMTQAQSTEGPPVRAALEALDRTVEGVVKTYRRPFNASNHDAIVEGDLTLGVIRGGKVVRP
jgi:branched-chain amino acid transport system substrate-binding protein